MAQSLSNLPIGAKIKFGKHSINGETAQSIIWKLVEKNHSGYPSGSITFLTDKIIDLRCYDAKETNAVSGNNYYSVSNIDQWLNKDSAAGEWYVAAHSGDTPPDTSESVANRFTQYENRPGFLYHFDAKEKSAILDTSIKCWNGVAGSWNTETIVRKMFLLSFYEIGGTGSGVANDGEVIPYVRDTVLITSLTSQVNTHSQSNLKQAVWWTRSAVRESEYDYPCVQVVSTSGETYKGYPYAGTTGVRPAMNLSSTLSISDTTDSDGCYTVVWNSAPPVPTTLTVPTVYGGKSTTITWSKVTDPDGNTVTYQLEQSIGGAAFTTLYSGANLSYSTVVPFGTTSVQFRVKATDSAGASSAYKTSSSITVVNNNAPVISGSDGNLGTQFKDFTQTYSVTDANNNTVTITEAIDGVNLRSYTATLGATNTFSITGNTWLTLANGIHTLTITANDGIDRSVRTYTFVKAVTSFTVQKATAIEASAMPTRIKVTVIRTIPPEATFKVEVCNNGFDANPTWEDATSSVTSELVHVFSNKSKTSAKWGVNIRVTVNRNNGSGACYITSIGGNWE